MNTKTRNMTLALMLALTTALPAAAAQTASEARPAVQEQVDRVTTGSVLPAGEAGCQPRFLGLGADACAPRNADGRNLYPQAPVNPAFGF